MTDPTGTPYGDDVPDVEEVGLSLRRRPVLEVEEVTEHDPGTAQTEAEITQGTAEGADRSVRPSWLTEGAQVLLDTTLAFQSNDVNDARPVNDAYFEEQAIEQIKALMLAGWSSPHERTLAAANGLMLREEQWRTLAEGGDVHVMLPGGRQALVIEAVASHGVPHFAVGSELHGELWSDRERTALEAVGEPNGRGYGKTGPSAARLNCRTCGRQLNTEDPRSADCGGDCRQCLVDAGDEQEAAHLAQSRDWKVPVPRSFLTSLVTFARALREAGDFAAANSLDNFLASIAGELRTAGVEHADHGHDSLPTPPESVQFTVNVHRDDLRAFTSDWSRSHPAPRSRFIHPAEYITDDVRERLIEAVGQAEGVREHLLPALGAHPVTRDAVAVREPGTLRPAYLAKQAVNLITWYANEVTRLKNEGIPGVIHNVDRLFYDLAVKERDLERAKVERLESELKAAREAYTRVTEDTPTTARRELIRAERQRDELRAAIRDSAGLTADEVNEVDTDFVKLAGLLTLDELVDDAEVRSAITGLETNEERS